MLVCGVFEGSSDDPGSSDDCVVERICVVVGECVVEDDDTVLVRPDGGDAVDVVVAIPMGARVVVAGVSICSLHIIITS